MNTFASGPKRSYYGKGDVIVYRLYRDGRPNAVFGANVKLLIYGDAFWQTYTTGDNTGLVATDSMKNFIQRETLNFDGNDLESYCNFLADKFLTKYPQAEGAQVSATEIPYSAVAGSEVAFVPAGPASPNSVVELTRRGDRLETVEARSGITGFRLLRLKGSAFTGFVRDEYTTLPDILTHLPASYVAGSRLDVYEYRFRIFRRSNDTARKIHCGKRIFRIRVREYPANHLSDWTENAGGDPDCSGGSPGGE